MRVVAMNEPTKHNHNDKRRQRRHPHTHTRYDAIGGADYKSLQIRELYRKYANGPSRSGRIARTILRLP